MYPLEVTTDATIKINMGLENFTTYKKVEDKINQLCKLLESEMSSLIQKEDPLLKTAQTRPYLLNYCCNKNNNLSILEYINDSKATLSNILEGIRKDEITRSIINDDYIQSISVNIPKQKYSDANTEMIDNALQQSESVSEQIVYRYVIHHLNFDTNVEIDPRLEFLEIEKPSSKIYNKLDDLNTKIKQLKENGYYFDESTMHSIMNVINRSEESQKTKRSFMRQFSGGEGEAEKVIASFKSMKVNDLVDTLNADILGFSEYYLNKVIRINVNKAFKMMNAVIKFFNYDEMNTNILNSRMTLLKNLNYSLGVVFPNQLRNKYKSKSIVCKHWDLASQHNRDIQKYYNDSVKMLTINSQYLRNNDIVIRIQQELNDLKPFIFTEVNTKNLFTRFLYQKYIFYKILNVYGLEIEGNLNKKLELNHAVVQYVHNVVSESNISYEKLKSKINQTKQSEKLIKTDYLQKLTHDSRKVEKMKMNLKLGVWGFALQSGRVYKYSKDYYDEDKKDALDVQNVLDREYGIDRQLDQSQGALTNENDEYDMIRNEEELHMSMIPNDDEYNENYGDEYLDGDEMY